MKREIKFRVWDEVNKEFIPNNFYEICLQSGSHSFGRMLNVWKNYQQGEYFYEPNQKLNQFTGLKDKNGKEIYEGDIIQYRQHYFNICPEKQMSYPLKTKMVKWRADRWNVFETNAGESEIEIIGNIFENPELLEK